MGGLRNFRSLNVEQWQCCTTMRPADMLILPPHTILFLPPGDIEQVSQHQLSFLFIVWQQEPFT